MDQQADLVVDRLKTRFRVQTDQELADALKLGRSTVTSWRRRGSIPDIYVRMSWTDAFVPLGLSTNVWTPTEHAAFNLGMMRLIKGFGIKLEDYPGFLSKSGFRAAQLYSTVQQALTDLTSEMKARQVEDPAQCVNLMVYEEFFASK